MMKRFVDWKEAPVDCVELALNRFFKSCFVEVLRTCYGLGNYRIHPHISHLYNLKVDKPILPSLMTPEEMYDSIRNSSWNFEKVWLFAPVQIITKTFFQTNTFSHSLSWIQPKMMRWVPKLTSQMMSFRIKKLCWLRKSSASPGRKRQIENRRPQPEIYCQ